jgi:hypothetical protein
MIRLAPHVAVLLGPPAMALALQAPPAAAQRESSRLVCQVLENGEPASGTMTVRRGNVEVATGSCGVPVPVPVGTYEVEVRLDGALDKPTETRAVRVDARATAQVEVGFATGTLRVRIEAAGRRAAGMAVIFRDGRRIGSLGSGVAAHLSAGTYTVVVRYRTEEKRLEGVALHQGQDRTVDVAFP